MEILLEAKNRMKSKQFLEIKLLTRHCSMRMIASENILMQLCDALIPVKVSRFSAADVQCNLQKFTS